MKKLKEMWNTPITWGSSVKATLIFTVIWAIAMIPYLYFACRINVFGGIIDFFKEKFSKS